MGRGRPPLGGEHVDGLEGSDEAKRRLKRILQTASGELSVAEASHDIGVTETHFHRLRETALAGAIAALEPKPAGRPRKEAPAVATHVAELESEVRELKIDLRASQLREEIAVVMPHLLQRDGVRKKTRSARKKKKR